ncbi:DUF6193 family natural product biosynthesis protein [Streptomyces sp. NPDC000983]|uniref:DUF6193 family natural product biosynthesis protein n=1 Tax=Streptomyces sp. NPDC000983 TaxID=3154373 RepID=UPI003324D4BC
MTEQLPGATPHDPMAKYMALYPEVARAGSLRNALQAAAERSGHRLLVELTESPGWRHVAAQVAVGGRSVTVVTAEQERCFSVDCWAGGVHMATGVTDELSEVVGVMEAWPRATRVRELVAAWPYLRTWELAEAHELGEAEAVSVRWRQMRESAVRRQDHVLSDLLEAAYEQPRLRALSPGRSIFWLTFSRRAAPPACHDLPKVMPTKDGRFRVHVPGRPTEFVDSAAAAIAWVVAALPDDAVPQP